MYAPGSKDSPQMDAPHCMSSRHFPKVKSCMDLSVLGYVLAKALQRFLEEELAAGRCWAAMC